MVHLPLELEWNAKAVSEHIASQGVANVTHGNTVVVTVDAGNGHTLLARLSKWLFRGFTITVAVNPQRFIRNVELTYDPERMPLDFPCMREIRRGLREFGCLVADDREIALRYWPESPELSKLFDQIERIQQQKEECVAQQDFETAVKMRDEERVLRERADDMLRDHVASANVWRDRG